MASIIVLGSGMVGSAMAIDLAKTHKVTCVDKSPDALKRLSERCPDVTTAVIDASDATQLNKAIESFDLVISAVPGFMGYETLKIIIEAGKNVVDIAFFPEDALALHDLATRKGVTAIVDCGVAPGMGNIILGHYDKKMTITDYECLVGGLPQSRSLPFEYRAPFSPVDIIEEYTRPARYIENSKMVTVEPLTDLEYVDFDGIGTLQSFNSDGLRSLCFTMPHIPNMKEKTLRYPGHVDKILVLKQAGFFETDPIDIGGAKVSPLDFTSKILFNAWKLGETEEELTIMRLTIKGKDSGGNARKIVSTLYDVYDKETNTSSMARSTGYTTTGAANLFLEGIFTEKGIFPPEKLGQAPGCYEYILKHLEERGVHYDTIES
jgi:saccharopine dehydrogenase-like NADP-dependent oxidoreductase